MLTILLQAQGDGGLGMILMLVAMFAIMYFFMIRPQQKKQKEIQKFRNSIERGQEVITAGGIYGTVAEVDERTVLVKVDGETKLRVDKSSIQKDMSAEAPAQNDKK